jgi:hypothetical protein
MSDLRDLNPVVYDTSMEKSEPDEAGTSEKLTHTIEQISRTTTKDYGHAVRALHAKSHALLQGTLTVLDGLPPVLAQGMFAKPGAHRTVMRISTGPGDVLPDSISSPRGLAFKVFDVEGERLPGSPTANTQDFLFASGPVFGAPDAKHFAPMLALLAKTVDKAEGLKKVASALLQALEGAIEGLGGHSGAVQALGGKPNTNPLNENYYSQTPFLYGRNVAKFALVPVSENLLALKGKLIHPHGRPNALREEIGDVLRSSSAVWELRVQLCTDLVKMPLENAAVQWDEKASPFWTVARLEVGPQPAWTEARAKIVDDALAFDVWHGLAAHRPLGSINRVRQMVYARSSGLRREVNGCPMHEPKSVDLEK